MVEYNNKNSLNEYTMNIIDSLPNCSEEEYDSDNDTHYRMDPYNDHNKIKKDETRIPKLKTSNINNDILKRLDVNKFIDRILDENIISESVEADMSDFMCNETYYVTWNVNYKFGLIKINNLLK